jgi:phage terminase small subunit
MCRQVGGGGGGFFTDHLKIPARRRYNLAKIEQNIRARIQMRKKTEKPMLTVVSGPLATIIEPPSTLGEPGAKLWRSVMKQYDIRDAGGLAILEQACVSRDRSTEFAAIIAAEGSMIRSKQGPKEHPLIRHEREERALECRLLQKLGLDVEAVRPSVGRPGGRNTGVTWEQLHGHETSSD